jgi:hypothetical protein
MTLDLKAYQIGVIIRLSMKEDCAAVVVGHHINKRGRREIPRAVFEPSPCCTGTDRNSILSPALFSGPAVFSFALSPSFDISTVRPEGVEGDG